MVGRIFLNRYEAVRLLGEGGMGRVYLARQLDLGRHVVVKVMHEHLAADPKFCERFQRETLLMARFQHPYAVTLYDASLNDPQGPCIIMEYIRGVTLDQLLRRNGRLSVARVGRLLNQICEVLQAAHSEGIIHRDLKPANLMVVDPDTPYEKIKIMDFGLAKLASPTVSMMNITEENTEFAVGTPGYMCPEQAKGEEMDHRGDLYSIGIILYELLTGRLPFTGGSTMDIMIAHVQETPPSFAAIGLIDAVSPAIEKVVLDCLQKDPQDRPSSARELAERYEAALMGEQTEVEAVSTCPAALDHGDTQANNPATIKTTDPLALVHHIEAWMPETVAQYKLRGFVQDVGGEVLESVPGRIRVRLGARGSFYGNRSGSFRWLGLGRKNGYFDMELQFKRADPERDSLLRITVVLKPCGKENATSIDWRERGNQIFCDLRAYVMGRV